MKREILSFILILSALYINAQCNLPYKPLSSFGTDTTAFIIYNFMDRRDCYKGKTIKEVVKDLSIPVKYESRITSPRGEVFIGIYIYIYDDVTASLLRDNKKEDNAIEIYWEKEIDYWIDPDYQKNAHLDWSEGFYDYVKDMPIMKLGVSISRYSKYYEKYKTIETRSRSVDSKWGGSSW